MNVEEICGKIMAEPDIRIDTQDLLHFLKAASDLLMKEKNVVRTSGSALFIGDLHGDLASSKKALEIADERELITIFLGDYVDRGSHQLEVMNLVLARKLLEPSKTILLRGNHEFKRVNMRWGFADVVMGTHDETTYWLYNAVFSAMPLAAILNNKVMGVHGGLASNIEKLEDINMLQGDSLEVYDERLGIIWNDPDERTVGIVRNNKRGVFFTFGRDVFDNFMENNSLDLLIRAHSEWPDGYKYFFDKRCISVFSCADHYKDVKPKVVAVDENGQFEILGL